MKYSVPSNMSYVYKASIKHNSKIIYYLIVNFITEILTPIAATLIVTLVVYTLTNTVNISSYVLIILASTLITLVLESLRYMSFTKYSILNTFTRNSVFWIDFAYLQITTDYMNIEPKEKRTIIQNAFMAVVGNFLGIEMLMKQTPLLFINLTGMIVYGIFIRSE